MTIVANEGPTILGFPSAPLAGMPANTNPNAGPSMAHHGMALLDPRTAYTYIPGKDGTGTAYGLLSGFYQCMDQAPATKASNNIAAAQTATAGTALTLVSSSGAGVTVSTTIKRADTGATVTGLLALDSAMTSVGFGQSPAIQVWDPTKSSARNIIISSNGNDSSGTYTIAGYDIYGFPMTEALTGSNATTAVGQKAWKYITSVTPSGTVNSTGVTVGTGDVFGLPLAAARMSQTLIYWGNPPALMDSSTTASADIVTLPATLSAAVSTSVFDVTMPFDGTVQSVAFRVSNPGITTGSIGFQLRVNGTTAGVTGGAITLAANANASASGAKISGTTVTGGNSFTAGQSIGMNGATMTTAFTTGSGWFELTVVNSDVGGGTFTAAVTSTATSTSGDVRGTYAVPNASDGTKRLVILVAPPPGSIGTATAVFGVTQA
jgi:hypothetical protein